MTHITTDQSLTSASYGRFDTRHPLKSYDDGYGPVWIYLETLGPVGLVRATTLESAFACVCDEILTPLDPGDWREAYPDYAGCDADWDCTGSVLQSGHCSHHPESYRNMGDGYHTMPNAGESSGIVAMDPSGSALVELTEEHCAEWGIELQLETDD